MIKILFWYLPPIGQAISLIKELLNPLRNFGVVEIGPTQCTCTCARLLAQLLSKHLLCSFMSVCFFSIMCGFLWKNKNETQPQII